MGTPMWHCCQGALAADLRSHCILNTQNGLPETPQRPRRLPSDTRAVAEPAAGPGGLVRGLIALPSGPGTPASRRAKGSAAGVGQRAVRRTGGGG